MSWFVPGRIEVLGKHTDYAGGRSLLLASEQGVTARAQNTDSDHEGKFEAHSTASPDTVFIQAGEASGLPQGHWGNYIQTVVDRLTMNFGPLQSARIDIDSTLPLASGMSSSSALIVAVALELADQNGLWDLPLWKNNIDDGLDLASYAASIENGADFKDLKGSKGVGTFGGSQDHAAMINCEANYLTPVTYFPLTKHNPVPVPNGWIFVVAVSGVMAEKTGAALKSYNDVSLRVSTLVDVWNNATGSACITLGQVLNQSDSAAEQLADLLRSEPDLALRPDLMERLLAYLVEVGEVIPTAEAALRDGDLDAFGVAVDKSHRNADQNLHNQVDETNELQRIARELGAVAASAFGAGFGGSVWALVQEDQAEDFSRQWLEDYLERFPQHAERASTLLTKAAPGAHRI